MVSAVVMARLGEFRPLPLQWGVDQEPQRMRLSEQTREVIRETTQQIFGPEAKASLFGSRVDDSLRGGDVDLLIELPAFQPDLRRKSLTLAARLQCQLGDQPIDIVVVDPDTEPTVFETLVRNNAKLI